MVTAVTSFGRSGLSDWLLQRVTSIIVLLWFCYVGVLLVGGVEYAAWNALFERTWMKIFTLLAVLSLAVHAWIGMWSVGTDYLTQRLMGKTGNLLRLAFQIGCGLMVFIYVIWGVQILWGS
tara:strand:+ start:4308 stop:4670 length:363 start_codon:yes stop_codon:yes gene_type:complete